MRTVRHVVFALALLALPSAAHAQMAKVVSVCDAGPLPGYVVGQSVPLTVDPNGKNCSSATLSGGTSAVQYNTVPPTMTNGSSGPPQSDVNGNTKVNVVNSNPNGLAAMANSSPVVVAQTSHASTAALGTSLLVKASAGNLFGYYCNAIAGAATGYCIAYNSATVPAANSALTGSLVLDNCYLDGTAAGCSLSRIPASIAYSAGIVILISSAVTPFTYTTGTDTGFIAADFN